MTSISQSCSTIQIGNVRQVGDEAGFTAPAYRPADPAAGERWSDDHTGPVPAAHGGIAYIEEEDLHGRQRCVAENGGHREVGPWGPTRQYREALAREEARRRQRATERIEDQIAGNEGYRVIVAGSGFVTIDTPQRRRIIRMVDLERAAADPWHPRLTAEEAMRRESEDARLVRMIYRSLLRCARQLAEATGSQHDRS